MLADLGFALIRKLLVTVRCGCHRGEHPCWVITERLDWAISSATTEGQHPRYECPQQPLERRAATTTGRPKEPARGEYVTPDYAVVIVTVALVDETM